MSEFANKVKYYYQEDLWSLDRVNKALTLGKITQEEYDEIIKVEEVVTPQEEN